MPGIRKALDASSAPIVAVSPIVSGAPIKGPAHTLMRALGIEVSALGVARFYAEWIDGFVFDERDAALLPEIEALGLAAAATGSPSRRQTRRSPPTRAARGPKCCCGRSPD